MKYIAVYMFLGFVICLVVFCAHELNEVRKYARQYAEAKARVDALIWKEGQDCMKRLEEIDDKRRHS